MNMEGTAVLLSIRPEWCQKIFRGEKTMEIRKSFPKDFQGQPFKCFIYCTKGQNAGFRLEPDGGLMRLDGTVIGEFTCDRVYEIAPLNHAPDDLEAQALPDALKHPKDRPTPHCAECEHCIKTQEGQRGTRKDCAIGWTAEGYEDGGTRHIPTRGNRQSPDWCPRRKDDAE